MNIVSFGRYKGMFWSEMEDNYVFWYSAHGSMNQKEEAQKELKIRRGY